MSACDTTDIVPVSRPLSFASLLLGLPEELILEILEHLLTFPGVVARTKFFTGECEWPSCLCQGGRWKHVRVKKLTRATLVPLLEAPEPIPRLARLVFYTTNRFHFCGPQNDEPYASPGFWLPPPGVRHWIRHIQVEVQIAIRRQRSVLWDGLGPMFVFAPSLDWNFLRRLQRGVHGFTGLRSLKLMFEALFITKRDNLQDLDEQLGAVQPFCFQTQELIVEACSVFPAWLDDDAMSGDIVHDADLESVLRRHMLMNKKRKSSPEDRDRNVANALGWLGMNAKVQYY